MSVFIEAVSQAAITSGSDQDFDVPEGFGEPKAAMIFVSRATSDSEAANAGLSVGGTDGTRSRVSSTSSEDNVGTTDTYRINRSDSVIYIMDPTDGSVDARASLSSFSEDQMTLTWNQLPSSAYLVTAVLFGGTDLSAYCGDVSNSSGDVDVTDPGFEPTAVFVWSTRSGLGATSQSTNGAMSFGFASNFSATVNNRSMNSSYSDNSGTSQSALRRENTAAGRNIFGGSVFGGIQCTNFDDSGFTASQVSGGSVWHYLAIDTGTYDVTAEVYTPRTTTGVDNITSPGFAPHVVIMGMNHAPSTGSNITNSDANAFYITVLSSEVQATHGLVDEDNAGTSDTSSEATTGGPDTKDFVGNDAFRGSLDGMTSNGFDVDYTAVEGSTCTCIYIALSADTYGVGTPSLEGPSCSATGTVEMSGSGTPSLEGPESTGSGTVTSSGVTGTGAPSLEGPSCSATGTVTMSGSGSPSLEGPESTGSGVSGNQGSGSPSLEGPSCSASGVSGNQGSGTPALEGPSCAATGTVTMSGSGSPSLEGPSCSATGTVGDVTGTGTPSLEAPSAAATGIVEMSGSGAPSLEGPESTGTGISGNQGSGAPSLEGPSCAATGIVEMSGSGAPSLEGPSASATGTVEMSGSGSPSLEGPSCVATGVVGDGISGTGAPSLEGPSCSATGTVTMSGSGSPTLEAPGCSATGTVTMSGSGAPSLEGPEASGAGISGAQGSGSPSLEGLSCSAAGTVSAAPVVDDEVKLTGSYDLFTDLSGSYDLNTDLTGSLRDV